MTYKVNLTQEDKEKLENIVKKGKYSARTIKRANILLLVDKGEKVKDIEVLLRCCKATIKNTKKSYIENGLKYILEEKPRPGQPKKLDGRQEAMIIATACSNPPEGRVSWTLELLKNKFVEFNVSETTIGRTLKKMKLSLGS